MALEPMVESRHVTYSSLGISGILGVAEFNPRKADSERTDCKQGTRRLAEGRASRCLAAL